MIKEPYHIFKDQSQGFLGVDDVMQQHDVGMLQALQKRRCRATQGESVNRGHGADGLQDPASYCFLLAELSGFNIHSKRGAMGDQGEIKSEGEKNAGEDLPPHVLTLAAHNNLWFLEGDVNEPKREASRPH